MFLNQPMEQLARPALFELQNTRFKTMLERIYEKTSLYHERLTTLSLSPDTIRSLQDIDKLPFTTKQDLEAAYPYGFLTMPLSGTARFLMAEKIAIGFTCQDIYQQIETVARSLVACNIIKGSVMLLLSKDTSHLAVQQAAEGIGVTVIPALDTPEAKIAALQHFSVTTLAGTAEDFVDFANYLASHPELKGSLLIKNALCCTNKPFLHNLAEQLNFPVYWLYGHFPIAPASLAGECSMQKGLHIYEDCFYAEIINPETNLVLPPHTKGELVITTLTREAMPLLRYRTGTLAILDDNPCTCGRTAAKLQLV